MKITGVVLFVIAIAYGAMLVPVLFLGSDFPTSGLIAPLVCGGSDYHLVAQTAPSR